LEKIALSILFIGLAVVCSMFIPQAAVIFGIVAKFSGKFLAYGLFGLALVSIGVIIFGNIKFRKE
jgi:hypothetical protein